MPFRLRKGLNWKFPPDKKRDHWIAMLSKVILALLIVMLPITVPGMRER